MDYGRNGFGNRRGWYFRNDESAAIGFLAIGTGRSGIDPSNYERDLFRIGLVHVFGRHGRFDLAFHHPNDPTYRGIADRDRRPVLSAF